MMKNIEIDNLVKKIDDLGGPDIYNFDKLSKGYLYKIKYKFNYDLDPLSNEYIENTMLKPVK